MYREGGREREKGRERGVLHCDTSSDWPWAAPLVRLHLALLCDVKEAGVHNYYRLRTRKVSPALIVSAAFDWVDREREEEGQRQQETQGGRGTECKKGRQRGSEGGIGRAGGRERE